MTYWKCCEKWLPLRQPMKPHVMQIQRSSHAALRSQPCIGASSAGDGSSAFGESLFLELLLALPVRTREFCLAVGAAQS